MKKYTTYKDSGIKWIGKIPEHWELQRLKYCLQLINQKTTPNKDIRYVGMENIESWSGRYVETSIETDGQANLFEEGDILFGKLRPYLAKVHLTEFRGCCSSELLVYRSKNQSSNFLQKLLITKGFIDLINASTYGAKMPRANSLFVGQQVLPIPPLSEQQSIVSFLEKETAQIDSYIKLRQQELDALTELKQAEIAHAVTKGINPKAKLKPSGIKWIGEVPEHWEINQLRKYLKLVSVKNKPNEQLLSVTREQGVIVRNIESKEDNHNYIPEDLSGYKFVKKGQFVINKMKSWQGSYGVSLYDGIVSPAYFVCELNKVDSAFFSRAIRSKAYVGFFAQMSKGIRVDQWDLSPIGLKQIPFFTPPLSEQQAIVNYIDKRVNQIDDYSATLQTEIAQMQEYKQRLISDAVTGKIKV